mmetsp:Transcript_78674/g.138755  ORF Transcript_78674/g.138755 Transcript_78674/m.138755 type:complete len:281 (-) Transcript_78674:64-906(-)
MARLDGISEEAAMLRASLQAMVHQIGTKREEMRARQQQEEASAREREAAESLLESSSSSEPRKASPPVQFAADLVLREETGFELWLGSLEDALNLRGLRERGISAVLNCALEDCEAEVACFRPTRSQRRARSHTRNRSMEDGALGGGWIGLHRDQVWSLASFDADWYSDVLELDVAYEALAAKDEVGYNMQQHYPEVTEFLKQCRRDGKKVLVHCVMGINRSVSATVAFLAGSMGMSLKAAVRLAAERRGCVLSNASFLDQLIRAYGSEEMARTSSQGYS